MSKINKEAVVRYYRDAGFFDLADKIEEAEGTNALREVALEVLLKICKADSKMKSLVKEGLSNAEGNTNQNERQG
jgi:hypothetical protein